MKAEFINPFIHSTISVFDTMLGCKLVRTKLYLREQAAQEHTISGIIGLCGRATGTVVLRMNCETALSATEIMLGERPAGLNADVKDAVGELANMVAGGAKTQLAELNMSLAIATVVTGTFSVEFPSKMPPICIEFNSPWGPVVVEVGLVEQPAYAAV